MPLDNHERARLLLHRSLVERVSREDQQWLNAHVEQCAECGQYADLSARAVRALDWFALEPDPAAALRIENVIRSRAEAMKSAEAHARTLWLGAVVSIFLTVTGSAIMWNSLAWLASKSNLPVRTWQIGFAALWFLPSLLLAFLPLFRSTLLGETSDRNGGTI